MLSDLKKIWKNYLKKNVSPEAPPSVKKCPETLKNSTLQDKRKKKKSVQESQSDRPLPEVTPPSVPEERPSLSIKKTKKISRATDKHGFRKIRLNEDLDRLFDETTSPAPEGTNRSKIIPTIQARRLKNKSVGKPENKRSSQNRLNRGMDKHGFPILSENFNLMGAFEDPKNAPHVPVEKAPENPQAHHQGEDDFEKLLTRSISGKNIKKLLQEKDSLYQHAKPVTLSEKIKRYPAPESELDLHGFTAAQAREKADLFVRNSVKTGRLTIRIIVGKGLHSEDQAVLPDVVEEKIKELKKENIVLSYRWEKHIKKKSGAMIVYLV